MCARSSTNRFIVSSNVPAHNFAGLAIRRSGSEAWMKMQRLDSPQPPNCRVKLSLIQSGVVPAIMLTKGFIMSSSPCVFVFFFQPWSTFPS